MGVGFFEIAQLQAQRLGQPQGCVFFQLQGCATGQFKLVVCKTLERPFCKSLGRRVCSQFSGIVAQIKVAADWQCQHGFEQV